MKSLNRLISVLIGTAIIAISGCKKTGLDEIATSNAELSDRTTHTLLVNMTSSNPGIYKEVNVEINSVEVSFEGVEGWVRMVTNAGPYHLVAMQNTTVQLARVNFPGQTGKVLKNMRIQFGNGNSVELGDVVRRLQLSTDAVSGVIIGVNRTLNSENESILINFDISASVEQDENGQFILSPVITPM